MDKNNLPLGVLWRRVYEITGGEWNAAGAEAFRPREESSPLPVWENSIFAYNLSIACNHCVHPKCAGVCPVNAYQVRPDGIVLIDTHKCIGCGYCAWACPYDAPQIDKSAGVMTKCNLCYDNLDAGLPPACVAACPLRCLELVQVGDHGNPEKGLELWDIPASLHPYPLPSRSRTRPHLLLKPHPAAKLVGETTQVNNREEISATKSPAAPAGEIPLIFFTLLSQIAIGTLASILMILLSLSDKLLARQISLLPLLGAGLSVTAALFISFSHLGTPHNAWRVLHNLRKSWLSREIMFISSFAGLLAILMGLRLFQIGSNFAWISVAGITLLCGLAALVSMQRVYQFRTIPGWNKLRTLLEFSASTLGLGGLLTASLLPKNIPAGAVEWIPPIAALAFLAGLYVTLSTINSSYCRLSRLRIALLLAALGGCFAMFFSPTGGGLGIHWLVFGLALIEEALGRWLFYARRQPGI